MTTASVKSQPILQTPVQPVSAMGDQPKPSLTASPRKTPVSSVQPITDVFVPLDAIKPGEIFVHYHQCAFQCNIALVHFFRNELQQTLRLKRKTFYRFLIKEKNCLHFGADLEIFSIHVEYPIFINSIS